MSTKSINERYFAIYHDGGVHHPLGAGSYIFKNTIIPHMRDYCDKGRIVFQIGAQPNNSPHMGTLVTFALAFALAKRMKEYTEKDGIIPYISLDIVDTAPSEEQTVDGVRYQRSQRFTGEMASYMDDYKQVMNLLGSYTGLEWVIRTQHDFLSNPKMCKIISDVVRKREELVKSFAPDTGYLALRSSCPIEACGLADKHGIKNVYDEQGRKITFFCPAHGAYDVNIDTVDGIARLEFNAPLRNLIRSLAQTEDEETTWIRITGSDYAGYYQEQLLWRHLEKPPIIFYAPLILDWSGAKLSKTLYVKEHAYDYLEDLGLDYLVSFDVFKKQKKDFKVVYDEVLHWVDNPKKLFRHYSIAYINMLFHTESVNAIADANLQAEPILQQQEAFKAS